MESTAAGVGAVADTGRHHTANFKRASDQIGLSFDSDKTERPSGAQAWDFDVISRKKQRVAIFTPGSACR
jgi:hypothetical protein